MDNHVFPKGAYAKLSQAVSTAVDALRDAVQEARLSMTLFIGEDGEPYNVRVVNAPDDNGHDADSHFHLMASAMFEQYPATVKIALQKSGVNPLIFFSQNFFGNVLVVTFLNRLNLFTFDEDGDKVIEGSRLVEVLQGESASDLVSRYFYDAWFHTDVEDARRLVIQMTNDNRLSSTEAENAFRHILNVLLDGMIESAEKAAQMIERGEEDDPQSQSPKKGFSGLNPASKDNKPSKPNKFDISNLLDDLDLF